MANYIELLERVKKVVPVLQAVPNEQIKISYKDVQLGTFANINSQEPMHFQKCILLQQSLGDKKLALETHVRELELNVVEPPGVGTYNGHRSDGNKGKDKCKPPPCTSYFMCGQKKKQQTF